jgi:hypothetical protein
MPDELWWAVDLGERVMLLVLLTFLATTALYAVLVAVVFRRVALHLQGNAEAMRAVTEHVLVPLLGRKKKDPDADAPEE